MQDRDGNNAIQNEYAWGLNLGGGIGGLLHLAQHGQNYSYLYDGSGNVEAVLDASQQLAAAYRYDPFGNLLAQSGSLIQPFGFSTKRSDMKTGLVHYQYRQYSPSMSRWISRDPLGEAGDMNLYVFVENDPINLIDPWGLTKGGPQHGSGPGTSADKVIQNAKEALELDQHGKGRDTARKMLEDEIQKWTDTAKSSKGKERSKLLKRIKQLRAALKTLLRNPKGPMLIVVPINPVTRLPMGMCPINNPNEPYDPINNPGGYI